MTVKRPLGEAQPNPDPFVNPCQACAVRDMSLCAVLEPEEHLRLAHIATQLRAAPNETIFYEGDPAQHLFNVTEGAVKTYKLLADGRRQITGFFFPGDFLGLALHDRYAYSAEAVAEVGMCRFPRGALEKLLDEFPKLEKRLLQIASNELAAAQDQMLLLGRKSARERIATFLLALSERAERRGQSTDLIMLPMSRGDIGDYLGLTIETVSRTFTRLKKDGLLGLPSSHEAEIRDRSSLVEIAGIEVEEPLTAAAYGT